MKMYEVKYTYASQSGNGDSIEQVTETRLDAIKKAIETKKFYVSVKVLRELGEHDTSNIHTWYKIGNSNCWISAADDPSFSEARFTECKTLDYLMDKLYAGNWCLGQAFYYKNLCFINQVDGGDEWLVIRDDLSFESASCRQMIKDDGRLYLSFGFKIV